MTIARLFPLILGALAAQIFSGTTADAADSTAPYTTTSSTSATAAAGTYANCEHERMVGYAEKLALADHATIFRLSGKEQFLPEGAQVQPGNFAVQREYSPKVDTRALDAATAQPLLTALHDFLLAPPLMQARCFFPAWGIDVYTKDGTLIFHGMFCFGCMGYLFQMGDSFHHAAMPGDPEKSKLHSLLDQILPKAPTPAATAPAAAP